MVDDDSQRLELGLSSLVVATDLDTLPSSAVVIDRGRYVVVRSPSNPAHYWGNFLLYRTPPARGDREQWEAGYEREFGAERESMHVAFTWDVANGERGAADEFAEAGYDVDGEVGLIATPDELVAHPRANGDVEIVQLDPDGDDNLWREVVELQVANREPGHEESFHRTFVQRRLEDRKDRFRAGDGAWFIARTRAGARDEPVAAASCGVIVTGGRARFQAVDTLEQFRRLGIATRLVHDAGRAAIEQFGADHLVIVAEADYHALPLYKSLGFVERERTWGACWWPGGKQSARHPRWGNQARTAG